MDEWILVRRNRQESKNCNQISADFLPRNECKKCALPKALPSPVSRRYVMNFDSLQPEKLLIDGNSDTPIAKNALAFGSFLLLPGQHLLLKNGEAVPLGSRAMLLLIAMASRAGELLEKADLLALVWPKVVVEECNLRAQIRSLRRALGGKENSGWIVTVTGRGYRFVAPISTITFPVDSPTMLAVIKDQSTIRSVFGREALLAFLEKVLLRRGLLTITGHPGIGKTTLASALGERMRTQFPQGIKFVDLAPMTQEQNTYSFISSVLGHACTGADPLHAIVGSLSSGKALLILDNCEHVLGNISTAIEVILRSAPLCQILVTSREPIRVKGEYVHNLAPLRFPPTGASLSMTNALSYSAIELFVDRVCAHDLDYVFSERDVQAAATICRKLDGNPLAIEIAAARVQAFGVHHLMDMLDGPSRLQMSGRRTAVPRHRSLSTALDWTYQMLQPLEQMMFRQLSVFTGWFTLQAAQAVIDVDGKDCGPLIESLMSKSVMTSREQGTARRYKLLETTRIYATQKLAERCETDITAVRHARWTRDRLRASTHDLTKNTPHNWLARYGMHIDSVRAALDWAYSSRGDHELAVELTLASAPLWLRLSLTEQGNYWVTFCLRSACEGVPLTQRQHMLLMAASANFMSRIHGGDTKIRKTWLLVRAEAESLNDTEHQLLAVWGLWSDCIHRNQCVAANNLADQYMALSKIKNSGESSLVGLRMRANTLLQMGRLGEALESVSEALCSSLMDKAHLVDPNLDQRIAARSLKAQIQLLQGDQEVSLITLAHCFRQSLDLNHPATLWHILCFNAIPSTLLLGDLWRTRYYLLILQGSLKDHDLCLWHQLSRCYELILSIRQDEHEESVPHLGEILRQLKDHGDSPLHSLLYSDYAKGLSMLGLEYRALEVIEQTLKTAISCEERWFLPELLRTKAQILIKQIKPQTSLAQQALQRALIEATQQGSHLWRKRITADLFRLQMINALPSNEDSQDKSSTASDMEYGAATFPIISTPH